MNMVTCDITTSARAELKITFNGVDFEPKVKIASNEPQSISLLVKSNSQSVMGS